jgi:hypothetical protein
MRFDLAVVLSIVALAVSCLALWRSRREPARSAMLHLEFRKALREVHSRSAPLTLAVLQNPGQIDSSVARDSIGEDLLCIYEEACSAYLEGRLNPLLFRDAYEDEIRHLVEGARFQRRFDDDSPFQAILEVYRDWNDPVQARLRRLR